MKVSSKTKFAAIAVAALLALTACSSSDSMEEAAPEAAMTTNTIVDVASGNADFSTLVAALSAAGLVETLSGEGPFTVFAPTNAAFEALPAGLLDALLLPENKETLVKILTYHVVSGEVMAADVTDGDVATVEGQKITLNTMGGVTVNKAKVVTADVMADNGVIHAIDAVLVPSDVDVAALLK
jgi:uncharacterized surface protein with fasciclin (FAS1) repeats